MSTQLLEDLVDAPNLKLLSKFRRLVSIYIEKGQYGSGLYWASKAATLSSDAPEDVLRLAECLLLRREFHRAASLLRSSPMEPSNLRYSYLAAKALYEAGSFEEAHQFLSGASEALEKGPEEDKSRLSSLFLLKGYILEALDNRGLAAEAFKAALREDPTCYEAFQALVKHQILSAKEELDLLQSLQAGTGDVEEEELDLLLLTPLYEVALKKYNQPADLILPGSLAPLADNNDVIVNLAERAYYNCDYTLCYKLTSKVIKRDPFHTDCLPIHITCMVELQKPNDLFHLAHKLVDLCPESCISWYAVGCYYYLIKKHEPARRFLSKATQLDRVFGPAWLAYGHSFATENEHDQAIAAYFKACQLMKGCHLPLLYIGVEYSLTNNPNLAKTFFSEALSIAPKDPFVLHEMGVIYFKDHDYITAEMYFLDALRQVEKINDSALSSKWESLLNNLGHCSRKLEKFKEALNFHQQALVLKPLNASTYSAIGHVHALMGNMMEAVESFHKALGLRRDDTFSTSMLNIVIEQLMVTVSPFPDYPDDLPIFDVLSSKKGPRSSDREDLNATKPASLEDFTSNTPISTSAATAVIFSSTTAHNDNSSLSIDIDMMDMSESGILDNSL
eukprot:TRINITY_DN11576_c0_g1_i1.p1 TRINITY_DN11576_c0_g1~~TRINITY_DN11576_c0_g1_i1.p1  ORF type:complete len:631 (+),score=175.79 TRINITY_DN11576_c0_g1_i1:39-1895(+)